MAGQSAHLRSDIARRYKRKKGSTFNIDGQRISELGRYFRHRYGMQLPDDDAGRDDVVLMVDHILKHTSNPHRARVWIKNYAPWMTDAAANTIISEAANRPRRYRAETLARRIGLTAAIRKRLAIKTIGAIDQTKEERQQARKLSARQRARARRQPRADYLAAHSISRTKPWIAAGISRATWYRQQRETGPCAM